MLKTKTNLIFLLNIIRIRIIEFQFHKLILANLIELQFL